jgi:uncharacterized membrane protein YdjX (TVP38/TMEM64 family)
MDNIRVGREGTDFTIQIVITHLSSLIISVASGKIAQTIDYGGLFLIEVVLCLFVLLFIPYLYREKKEVEKIGIQNI